MRGASRSVLEWGRRGARGRGSQPRTRAAPGHRPGVIEAPREELADGGPLEVCPRLGGHGPRGASFRTKGRTKRDPKKARPGAEMRTPRWRAERRHVSERARALRKVAPIGAPSPSLYAGARGRKACPGPRQRTGAMTLALAQATARPMPYRPMDERHVAGNPLRRLTLPGAIVMTQNRA